ncbi:MAG: hypothetical protein Q4D19_02370 [Lautropia sp.]|nr:hypothetical protein [Lautropia sp.]
MIDVHSHYLPAVDDGPQELHSALMLLRHACRDGVDKIVLTPHIRAGYWENTLSYLRPRFEAFRKFVAAKNIEVELFLGAEVHFEPEAFKLLRQDELPFLGGWEGMKVMLLEFPDSHMPDNALDGVRYLVQQGVLPMIAHPERNEAVMARPRLLEPFLEEGCLLQLTAASVLGEFGQRAGRVANEIIRRGWATMVASDAHSLRARPSRMRAVRRFLTERYGDLKAEQLTHIAPARLLWERQLLNVDSTLRLAGASPWSSASNGAVPVLGLPNHAGGMAAVALSAGGSSADYYDAEAGLVLNGTGRAASLTEADTARLTRWPATGAFPPTEVFSPTEAMPDEEGREIPTLVARYREDVVEQAPRQEMAPADSAAAVAVVMQRLGPDGLPLRRQRLWSERTDEGLTAEMREQRAWREDVSGARDPWDDQDSSTPLQDIWGQRQPSRHDHDMDEDIQRMRREWQQRMAVRESAPPPARSGAGRQARPPAPPITARPSPAPAAAPVPAWEEDEGAPLSSRRRSRVAGDTIAMPSRSPAPAAGRRAGRRQQRVEVSADGDVIDVEVLDRER